MKSEPIQQALAEADAARKAGRWLQAKRLYQQAAHFLPPQAAVHHNLALACLALGEHSLALQHSRRAIELRPELWQAALVEAKTLAALGDKDIALEKLQELHRLIPDNGDVRLELASLALHELGDARGARNLVAPLLADPQQQRDATLTTLVSQLYDREGDATELSAQFATFAARYLENTAADAGPAHSQASRQARPRVGLISPQFLGSPVYYFCIGALNHLAGALDLVFFHRGSKNDWATDAFKAIAHDWIDVNHQDSEQLLTTLRQHRLDVLIDLGGWMDPHALRALAAKPARKMYKWVGGQSITTGLKAFDGFISDAYQTPPGAQALYTEPLILLRAGYVTYTPPLYLPALKLPAAGRRHFGIIANPAKVSRQFLNDLGQRLPAWQNTDQAPIELRFIDKRYHHPAVQQRIRNALPAAKIEFICPAGHAEYLAQVAELHTVIDTYPYTGGLTTVEALALGVPCKTRVGALFSERHTWAHCKYAGMKLAQFDLDTWSGKPGKSRARSSLLKINSPRINHGALAEELLPYLRMQ